MSVPKTRKRPSTVHSHRYDTAYVVVALPITGARPDDLAPPVVYRTRRP
ncbi:hypothetical protein [Dactylosporangium sp. CA-233914]